MDGKSGKLVAWGELPAWVRGGLTAEPRAIQRKEELLPELFAHGRGQLLLTPAPLRQLSGEEHQTLRDRLGSLVRLRLIPAAGLAGKMLEFFKAGFSDVLPPCRSSEFPGALHGTIRSAADPFESVDPSGLSPRLSTVLALLRSTTRRWSTKEIAARLSCSPRTLEREAAQFGLTVAELAEKHHLFWVEYLLLCGFRTEEMAAALGISQGSSLARKLRFQYGISSRELRGLLHDRHLAQGEDEDSPTESE